MIEASVEALAGWESFYVIVGSSGAALTGLQFVVMTLVSENRRSDAGGTEIGAFGTPTVVHFTMVLVIAAILSAPWPTVRGASHALDVLGWFGVGYTLLVTIRATRATQYRPVLEDWVFHVALPFVAYGALVAGALTLTSSARETFALFVIAAVSLLLLVIGIHNAWDTVTWVTLDANQQQRAGASLQDPEPPREQQTPVELL